MVIKEHKVARDAPDHRASNDTKAPVDFVASKASKDIQETKDKWEHRDTKARRVFVVFKENAAHKDIRVFRVCRDMFNNTTNPDSLQNSPYTNYFINVFSKSDILINAQDIDKNIPNLHVIVNNIQESKIILVIRRPTDFIYRTYNFSGTGTHITSDFISSSYSNALYIRLVCINCTITDWGNENILTDNYPQKSIGTFRILPE